ncbi:hypothetical protein FA15DRAFT_519056 [Coprinopsis marcescibilis]|uniref:Uncharacterized protein n=1 Tax=Coprinopsis marcescibilis TaxID=230819 RepID=A0A5C3KRH6_COPMA|nr:hypothetical protein FA15DRAFT_519056 [Coprinopsis marcescibilis]
MSGGLDKLAMLPFDLDDKFDLRENSLLPGPVNAIYLEIHRLHKYYSSFLFPRIQETMASHPKLVALDTDGTFWTGQLNEKLWGKGPNAKPKLSDNIQYISTKTYHR